MSVIGLALRLVPTAVKRELKRAIIAQIPPLEENHILGSLYTPALFDIGQNGKFTWRRQTIPGPSSHDLLPIPPKDIRMGYGKDDQEFLLMGQHTAESLRRVLGREGLYLKEGTSVLDWGCGSGRVLRHFAEEARHCEFWGVDQDATHILWAKQNLSPPFKFLTCTAYPHLPFEDGKFKLIYAISVFTHLFHLTDMWLMELRRILSRGGYAVLTILDEHTWQYLTEHEAERPFWLPNENLSKTLEADVVVLGAASHTWDYSYSFFKTGWIAREWGQYLDVVSFEPLFESYQTAVVLRKS